MAPTQSACGVSADPTPRTAPYPISEPRRGDAWLDPTGHECLVSGHPSISDAGAGPRTGVWSRFGSGSIRRLSHPAGVNAEKISKTFEMSVVVENDKS